MRKGKKGKVSYEIYLEYNLIFLVSPPAGRAGFRLSGERIK